jgi:hypothetical protein
MPATADRTPFELVEEGHGGMDDRLTEARRGAWTAAAVRVVLVLVTWSLTAAPALQATHPILALLCPLGYLALEGGGLALVLGYVTALARAASK